MCCIPSSRKFILHEGEVDMTLQNGETKRGLINRREELESCNPIVMQWCDLIFEHSKNILLDPIICRLLNYTFG